MNQQTYPNEKAGRVAFKVSKNQQFHTIHWALRYLKYGSYFCAFHSLQHYRTFRTVDSTKSAPNTHRLSSRRQWNHPSSTTVNPSLTRGTLQPSTRHLMDHPSSPSTRKKEVALTILTSLVFNQDVHPSQRHSKASFVSLQSSQVDLSRFAPQYHSYQSTTKMDLLMILTKVILIRSSSQIMFRTCMNTSVPRNIEQYLVLFLIPSQRSMIVCVPSSSIGCVTLTTSSSNTLIHFTSLWILWIDTWPRRRCWDVTCSLLVLPRWWSRQSMRRFILQSFVTLCTFVIELTPSLRYVRLCFLSTLHVDI